tara:strand:- start:254 stop:721 length:468 start_codon:yes stop_codon:yes gene_type:complete
MTEEDKSLVVRPTGIRKFNPQAESSLIARGLDALQTLENKNHEANYYYNLGNTYRQQDRLEEAIEAYNKAIEIKPDYHLAYHNLGNTYRRQGKYDQAIEAYNKAIEIKPDYHLAYYNLGNAYDEQDKYEEAIEAYNKAIEIMSNDAESYINRGNA